MAWLEQTSTGRYHVGFWYGGLKFKKALRTCDARAADARLHRVDENIRLLESGRLELPSDADVATFLLSDGKLNAAKTRYAETQAADTRSVCQSFSRGYSRRLT